MGEPVERQDKPETQTTDKKMLIVDIFYGASKDPVTEGFSPEEWSPNDNINDVVKRALDKEEKRDKAERVIKALEKGNPMIYEGMNPKYRSEKVSGAIGKYLVDKEHEGTKFQHLEIRVPEPQEGGLSSIEMLPSLVKDEELIWKNHGKIIQKYKPGNPSESAAGRMYGL